jgi:hypothetical protein
MRGCTKRSCILASRQYSEVFFKPHRPCSNAPQSSELGLTVLSQLSIVVQISAFVFSLAHSGIVVKVISLLRSAAGRAGGQAEGTMP